MLDQMHTLGGDLAKEIEVTILDNLPSDFCHMAPIDLAKRITRVTHKDQDGETFLWDGKPWLRFGPPELKYTYDNGGVKFTASQKWKRLDQ